MDTETILVIIGYILAIIFPLIGVIYGLILYFTKGDDEYIKKHAKYIIIVGIVIMVLAIIITSILGISVVGMAAMS